MPRPPADWYVVDAEGQTLAVWRRRSPTRCAASAATYTPHVDTATSSSSSTRENPRHRQQARAKDLLAPQRLPGGIKSRSLAEMLERRPRKSSARREGMLPRNRLARQQLTKLK